MFGRKSFVLMSVVSIAACQSLFAFVEDFASAGYDKNGVPNDWALNGTTAAYAVPTKIQPQTPDGSDESGMGINFISATKENLLKCTSKIGDEIVCNTVLAKLRIYVQPEADLVDSFQVVVSTNASWAKYEPVGDPIEIREKGRKDGEWVTFSRKLTLEGLVDRQPDLYVGLLLTPAGKSHATGYIRSLELNIAAAATPTEVCLKKDGIAVDKLLPGDNDLSMSVCVTPDPNDERLTLEGVYGVLVRNGIVSTNRLFRVEGTDEYTNVVVSTALDAGETLRISSFSKYTSTLPTAGVPNPDGFSYEDLDVPVQYVVGKVGSVWINELTANRIEIAGTTNRVMFSGWTLVVADGEGNGLCTADLGEAFNLRTNMINGVVGLDVRDITWKGGVPPTDAVCFVSLCNANGIAEHTVEMLFSPGAVSGQSGYAPWHDRPDEKYAYDWSGTTTDGTFDWGTLPRASFGEVNDGQGFNVPVSLTLTVNTLEGGVSAGPISYATVIATVSNINNSTTMGMTTNISAISEGGVAMLPISGCTPFPNDIRAVLSGSAFGWACEERPIVLTNGCPQTVPLTYAPTVAFDDFSKWQSYWSNEGKLKWEVTSVADGKATRSVLRLNTISVTSGTGLLKCQNYLSAHGCKMCSVEFDYRNTKNGYDAYDEFSVLISTNANFLGYVASSPALSNKREGYEDKWYRYRSVFELPEGFSDAPELWIELQCISQFKTHTYVLVDDLRIAFQDVALPQEQLTRDPGTPQNGDTVDFMLSILPQTTGMVSDVSAKLHIVTNDAEDVVDFAFVGKKGLTNDLSVADGMAKMNVALGPLLTGDTVTYYAAVHYDSDNRDTDPDKVREIRYSPDDATVNDDGVWIVEGEYGVSTNLSAYTFTVDGPALSIVGTPETTTNGVRFTVHGYSANLLSEVSIYVNGEKCAEQPFDYLGTNNQIRVTGEFVIETGLNASTTYTVTIKGKDGTGAELQEATFTFLTKPKEPVITGTPQEDAYSPTRAFDFYALAEADDVANLNFHWLLDETATKSGNGETNYTDNVEADGPHTVRVYVTDQESNVSPTNSLSWVVDTTKPTKPDITGTPANGSVTNGVAYDLAAKSDDVTLITYHWLMDGVETSTATNFTGEVAAGYAKHEVKCYAVDQAGNASETNSWTWTVDTLAPTDLEINGYPANGSVTNGTSFRLKATAKDDMALTYHWSLDGGDEVTTTGEAFENDVVGGYGKHVVTCYATDTAGNASVTNSWKWTVDTEAPTKPEISGTPANGSVTNEPNFHLSATSTDKTTITYHWLTNGVAAVSMTNFEGKVTEEVEFVVSCYATDEANNVSETNSVSWVYDCTPPTVPVMSGEPVDGVVTNGTEYGYTATSFDVHLDAFYWSLDGAAGVRAIPGAEFKDNVAEGYAKHTVRVFATDTAGNRSAETNWTWTVDTKKPTDLKLTGLPISDEKIIVTNGFDFAFTASANDDMELTYHWKTNGVEVVDCTSSNFVGQVSEGTNTLSVYAKDVAGNACDPVERTWVVDMHAPTNPVIDGAPVDGAITSVKEYEFTAESEDATEISYHWTLKRGGDTASTGDEQTFSGSFAKDGAYTVFVYATDEAGNVSETNSWSWIVDTTAPTEPVISGTPANGSVTNEPNFSLTAAAKDATLITYHWLTNGVAAADATNLVGKVEEEGLFEVKCYATDAAGNVSKTNDWSWTLDRTPPTKPVITDSLKKGKITNVEAYDLTAVSTDDHLISYHWTLGEKKETVTNFVGKVTSSGEYTDFTAFVYATDEAGNVSETNSLSWRLDTKHPTVTLTSTAAGRFNRKAAPMEVTATFSEEVTNFTYECVTVQTGTVSNEVETVEEKKVFKFWVYPEHYGVPTFIDEETVSVSIDANKVRDYAGNGNEASRNEQGEQQPLTRIYDTKSPIVTLTSETPDFFNEKFAPLKVTINVTGKGVTELAQESIAITNGEVSAFKKVEEKSGEDGVVTEQIYALEATPTKEALITVAVPEGVVTNSSGNVNPAADPSVTKTYDKTPPMNLAINGEPAQNKVTAAKTFDFEATADDLTAMTFHWTLNGVAVAGNETSKYSGVVEMGTNWVTVSATDAAGNTCAEEKRTWVVDFEDPIPDPEGITGVPAEGAVTNGTDFSFVFTATDATKITYHWTTNGVDVSDYFSTNLVGVGTAIEGTNVVTVYAQDEASNRCDAVRRTWVVDTIDPTNLVISGTPEDRSVTNGVAYDLTARADDATMLEFHWSIDGKAETVTNNFKGVVEPGFGTYEVTCYATDQAGNKSYTTNWTWTVDTLAPTDLEISGRPADGSVTNGTSFSLTATAKDDMARTYRWSLDGGAWTDPMAEGEAFAKDDLEPGFWSHEVRCFATDVAGNASETNSWRWTIDTVAPTNLVVAGAPAYDAVTNVAAFAFEASALDDTTLRYHWLTNGIEVVSTNLVGTAEEGTNTVQVWAEDAAHNVSVTNTIRWILDTIAPTKPVIDGTPTPKAITNDKAFSFSATAEDKTALTFFWTVDEQKKTGPEFSGEVEGDGEHTVSVYATDAAGNVSETSTFTWTLDTTAPDNLVITGTPADGSATNKPNYSLSATAEDATTLTFHWTLGDKTEAVTNFIGEVEEEGAYEVTCYATDAAGNSSVTNTWSWTFDMTPPTAPVISGTPANGSVTNEPNYDLTAVATDNLTTITYHWMTNGVAAADVANFVGEVNAEGVYEVSCYATDAADNVSATNTWSWTFDKTPPADLAISGKPEEGEVVATNGFSFAASSTDMTHVTYLWTLNGGSESTGEDFFGVASEGTNVVMVTATDEAGNVSTVSRTWVVDTIAPTDLTVSGLPGDGALTNDTFFAWTAAAQDATRLTYHWCLLTNGVEAVTGIETNEFTDVAVEGTNTVTVYAKDEAGNVSETNTVRWTVDLTPPTVMLSTDILEDHVINLADVFKVTVTFSEPVVGFTKDSVTVGNGTVTNVAALAGIENAYEVMIAPTADGMVSVRIDEGVVTDLAGNGNLASAPLERKCDVTRPTVTLESELFGAFSHVELVDDAFVVTVSFSEPVTGFTKDSVTVTNGKVVSVTESGDVENAYCVKITPNDLRGECEITIQVGEDAVEDRFGNGNVASEVLTCTYDNKNPTPPLISGTPANGTPTKDPNVNLFLTTPSTDLTEITYLWDVYDVNGHWVDEVVGTDLTTVVTEAGEYMVKFFAMDEAGNQSDVVVWSWTYEPGETPSGVPFGDSVQLKIAEEGVTNVVFTAVDFQPGEVSTFDLREFELRESQETAKEIDDLKMWFVVGTNLLDDIRWTVKVNESAGFTNGTLTVTIPAEATTKDGQPEGEPYESFYIFGVDNKEQDK